MPPPQGSKNPLEGPGDYTMTKQIHNDRNAEIDPLKSDLSGKTVFISGASRGIGGATAVSFAKAGASQIAIAARSDLTAVEKSIKEAAANAGRSEPEVLRMKMDVTDVASVEAAAKQIDARFGKLDILINNAGTFGEMRSVADSDPALWLISIDVNLRGPYLVCRSCIPLLLKGERKTIITVSSVGAHVVMPGVSAYQTSKLAVTRLMEFVSKENEDQGLVALSIHPGNVLTDLVGGAGPLDDDLKKVFVETPELSADSMVYLASQQRRWLAGRYVNVTWDLPELMSMQADMEGTDRLKVRMVL